VLGQWEEAISKLVLTLRKVIKVHSESISAMVNQHHLMGIGHLRTITEFKSFIPNVTNG